MLVSKKSTLSSREKEEPEVFMRNLGFLVILETAQPLVLFIIDGHARKSNCPGIPICAQVLDPASKVKS